MDIDDLYDPQSFERLSAVITREMAAYLQKSGTPPHTVLDWQEPEALHQLTGELLEPNKSPLEEKLKHIARQFLHFSNNMHSPHAMGHQVPPPLPLSAALAGMAALPNQGAAVFETDPFRRRPKRPWRRNWLPTFLGGRAALKRSSHTEDRWPI